MGSRSTFVLCTALPLLFGFRDRLTGVLFPNSQRGKECELA